MANVSPGVYKIKLVEDKESKETKVGVVLDKLRFELPDVLFGEDLEEKAEAISKIWHREGKILGACSVGQKGSGKSTLVELTANNEIKNGYPCLFVDEPYSKQVVEKATRILGDCVFIGDEFEKIFSARHDIADELLTFFSDKTLGKVLFLITANDKRGLSQFMVHRPGRFLFMFEFEGVTEKVVRQICQFYNVNEPVTEFIVKHAAAVNESIDSVIALAKNGHVYKTTEEFKELFQWLNVKKPSFKIYEFVVTGVKDSPDLKTRFIGSVLDGKWSLTDSTTGMTYDKSQFFKRGKSFMSYQNIDGERAMIELNYVEYNEPQEAQIDIPVKVIPAMPRPGMQ